MSSLKSRIDTKSAVGVIAAELLMIAAFVLLSGSGTSGLSTLQLRTAAPGDVDLSGVAAAEGSSLAVARADHVHSIAGNALINTAAQTGASQSEVLVALTSTAIALPAGTRAFELCNNSGSPMWCNPAGASAVSKARPIQPSACWTVEASDVAAANLSCITATAAQVSGSATTLSVIR